MAYSKKIYTGDGVTKLFTVTFPYIDPSHVTVTVNGTAVPYTFQSKYVIEFATAPGAGALIQLSRNSNPEARLVDFQDDSMGTEAMFNLNSDQLLFLTQEALDKTLEGSVIEQVQDIADAALASALSAASAAETAQDAAESITLPIPVASGGTGSTTQVGARTALGLGSAATKDTGTAADQVVLLGTGGKLPVVDGSNLTGIRRIVQDTLGANASLVTGTALIPLDDTLPQDTEGWQIQTRTITPTAVGNKIVVEAVINLASSVAATLTVALFKDSAVDAVAVSAASAAANYMTPIPLKYELTATDTNLITFAVRVGASAAGTTTLNGTSGARRFGGALFSYVRVYEVKA